MHYNRKINDIPEIERPYEKCESCGASSLSDSELLAVIIKTGTKDRSAIDLAEDILSLGETHELTGLMERSSNELMKIKGIGRVKCIQLQCVAEMSRRIWRAGSRRRLDLNSPSTIASYYMEDLRHLKVEQVYIMMFDIRKGFIKSSLISQGTLDSSIVTPRDIFSEALKYGAASYVLVHNHPSGNVEPSSADIQLTGILVSLGKIMSIAINDSIIIGNNCYLSFYEKGLLHE